jgi:hypothetical protein
VVYISPHCPDDPSLSIVTKIGKVGDMDELSHVPNVGLNG